jgi:hypothetical protein
VFRAKGIHQLNLRRHWSEHTFVIEEAIVRSHFGFTVNLPVVLGFHPRLRVSVELNQSQAADLFQHSHKPSFQNSPENFNLGILLWTVWARKIVDNSKAHKAFSELRSRHRPAIIGHDSTWDSAFLDSLT